MFWCYDRAGALACVVAEVHNTYGERHCYLLRPDAAGHAGADKAFYVSPFFAVDGRYEMTFTDPCAADDLRVAITLCARRPRSCSGRRSPGAPTRRRRRSSPARCATRSPASG